MTQFQSLVADDLLAQLPSALLPEGMRVISIGREFPGLRATYVTFEDDHAPEDLEGQLVEFTVRRDYDTGENKVTSYTVVEMTAAIDPELADPSLDEVKRALRDLARKGMQP